MTSRSGRRSYAEECVIVDKNYDAQGLHRFIMERGMTPVILGRSNQKMAMAYDRHLYRESHLVEWFIGKVKRYRRVFTWFDQLRHRYLGFWHFAAALIWLH